MRLIKNIALVIGILTVVSFSSCTKNYDDFGPQNSGTDNPIPKNQRVIVLNEGNFNWGNGSVSIIDKSTQNVANEVFKQVNSLPLGDVPQSMIVHDSLGYIVVNNSGKIEVVNLKDFSSVKTITGFTSPRYMRIISTNPLIAWVTDLYANKIWEVDLNEGVIIRSMPLSGWSENIYSWALNAYILNKTDSVIHILDIGSATIKNTFNLGGGIIDFVPWSETELMVLASKGIYKIDLPSITVDTVYEFPQNRSPSKLAIDVNTETIYFLEGSVNRLRLNKLNDGVEEIIPNQPGTNWYGIAVNSISSNLYVTDAKDFVQAGTVYSYSYDLTDSAVYSVGTNPQFMLFD